MSLMSAPATPENTPFAARAAVRRSFTVPPKLNPAKPPPGEIGASAAVETLYFTPVARVVSFSVASVNSRPNSSSGSAEADGPLPWTSPTERTVAAGQLEIYRLPGSVSFLHSGSLLKSILPRSQCWCIDGVSKFALQSRDQYYRIELPGETEEDMAMVEQLKSTLDKILLYEKTACPFRRGFNLDLPGMVDIKERRKSNRLSTGPAKKWRFNKTWRPEGAEEDEDYDSSRRSSVCISDTGRSDDGRRTPINGSEEDLSVTTKTITPEHTLAPPGPPRGMNSIRSVTAPPQLSLRSSPPSKVPQLVGLIDEAVAKSTPSRKNTPVPNSQKLPPTPESMQDEFTQFQNESTGYQTDESSVREVVISMPNKATESESADDGQIKTPKTARPLSDDTEYEMPTDGPERVETTSQSASATDESDQQPEDKSKEVVQRSVDITARKEPTTSSTISPNPSIESNSSLESWSSLPTTAPENFRLRRGYASTSSSSSYQSLASSLAETSLQRARPDDQKQQERKISRITGSGALFVRRTAAMFLGPPAHLVAMMFRIAAKIMASGMDEYDVPVHMLPPSAFRGHRRVPGSWDMSDDEEEWGM